jgi:hypothetical protein
MKEGKKVKAVTIYLRKNISKKVKIKMLERFGKDNLSALIRILIRKYLNFEIKITVSKYNDYVLNTNQTTENKIKINVYLIEKEKEEFENRIYDLLLKKRKRNKMINLLISEWLKETIKIKEQNFLEECNIKHK